MRKNIKKVNETDDSSNYSVEIIENTRTIQLLNKQKFFLDRFKDKLASFRGFQKKVAFYDAITFSLTQNCFYFSGIFCFSPHLYLLNLDATSYSVGLYLVYHGITSTNNVYIASQMLSTLSWALLFVSTSFNEIMHSLPSIESVLEIVFSPTCISDNEVNGIEPEIVGDVSIEKLIFAYPSRPQVS